MQIDEKTLRKTIGKNIALYRKAHGDTQAMLGQKLNYSDKAVSKWERGESFPDIYVLHRIAEIYGATVGNLIGESKPKIQASPYMHTFVYLFTAALIFVVATVLMVTFELFQVPFNNWMFMLYGAFLSALAGIVYSMLWWNLWWQLGFWSFTIWLGGLSILLTALQLVPLKVLMICCALQVLVIFWILYRRTRVPGDRDKREENENIRS